MSTRTNRRRLSLVAQTAELSMAVPQVMAHRLGRMAAAGASPSARDREEFKLMVDEKVAAFQESWLAMATQAVQFQQRMALQMWTACWLPLAQPAFGRRSMQRQWNEAGLAILGAGLAPVSRRASANAKRLTAL
ncbi:hypothetical protein GT347_10250 [Xylophilus rhododendri]|uniref:Phasin domain-containing protein n=1 Tax=Xylophilus rhododendri TaxID=2697032 RepID=A0A857J5G7_9BURK|nr:polyhydroxyalkanoate granule-associated phasin [Xylophilus rhododendri]QHI98339.1 hypothetical protein GT347_10250 [Xylophilus rhododendri]